MTKRRLAVTNRSAAFSPPACARRAKRRSSSASVIRGSFCMSWRYWSKAVEGEERKKPLDLLSPVVCISPLVATLSNDASGWRAPGTLPDAHVNYGRTQPSTATFHATGGEGGSLGFVRVVAIKM